MQTAPVTISRPATTTGCAGSFKLRWGAILAGTIAALAIQTILIMLGAGFGLAILNPTTNNHAVASFGAGAAVIQGVSAVLALWGGGWIAGRSTKNAGQRSGLLHGFMVWCVATVAAVVLLSTGVGWALGGLGKIVGGGLAMAGAPAVDGMKELAKSAAEGNQKLFGSFTEEGLSAPPAGATPADILRAKRELTYAVTRLFTGEESAMAEGRTRVIGLLVKNQGLTEPDAAKMVDGWVASYQMLKADAGSAMQALEKKTRETAEESADVLSVLSLCYFAAFVMGAAAACYGGSHGAQCAARRQDKGEGIPA